MMGFLWDRINVILFPVSFWMKIGLWLCLLSVSASVTCYLVSLYLCIISSQLDRLGFYVCVWLCVYVYVPVWTYTETERKKKHAHSNVVNKRFFVDDHFDDVFGWSNITGLMTSGKSTATLLQILNYRSY